MEAYHCRVPPRTAGFYLPTPILAPSVGTRVLVGDVLMPPRWRLTLFAAVITNYLPFLVPFPDPLTGDGNYVMGRTTVILRC